MDKAKKQTLMKAMSENLSILRLKLNLSQEDLAQM